MSLNIAELSFETVVRINQRVMLDIKIRQIATQAKHAVVRPDDLNSCLAGIFYQSIVGYMHHPLEKMAGLLLYRLAQGQFFLDGNKRTAVVAAAIFCRSHGLDLHLDRKRVNELIWGFAHGADGTPPKYGEAEAVEYIFANIVPCLSE